MRINGYVILACEYIVDAAGDRAIAGYSERDEQFVVATLYANQEDEPNHWFNGEYFLRGAHSEPLHATVKAFNRRTGRDDG
jgi:hypothetical protein